MAESPSELQIEIEKLENRHNDHPEGRFFVPLANAYRKMGEVEHAEALLREGLRQHPDYLSAHIVLGRCLADRGATEEAADEFRFVLSLDPQNLIALRTLGELAVTAGRTADAIGWYEQLLSVDPMNEEARRALESLPGAQPPDMDADFQGGGGWWQAPPESDPAPAALPEPEPAPFDVAADRAYQADPSPSSASAGPADFAGMTRMVDLDDDSDGEEEEIELPGGEVVTETIAELYARQGLHDRAAGVYRELIRRRGGDSTLERRLAELESALVESQGAAASSLDATPPAPSGWVEPEYAPRPDPAPELDSAPLADPAADWQWSQPAGYDAPEAESQPEERAEEAAHEPVGPGLTIVEQLIGILSFRPTGVPAQEPAPANDFPWESAPAPLPMPAPAPEQTLATEGIPEAVTPDARDDFFSFDSFLGGDTAPEPELPPAAPEPAPAAASSAPSAAAAATDEGGDDDLESFQAWLRSLKR